MQQTIKLSRKDRLEIKKKLSVLIQKPFSIIHETSPSFKQLSIVRIRRDRVFHRENFVPFPYYVDDSFSDSTQCRCVGMPANLSIWCYENITTQFQRYTTNIRIPKKTIYLGISPEVETYSYSEKYLHISPNKCTILLILFGREFVRGYAYNRKKQIKISYAPSSGRLRLCTDIENYDSNEMLKIIKDMIFEALIY